MTKHFVLATAMMLSLASVGQKKETPLLKIGNNVISREEFEFVYEKNNSAAQLPISKKEYFELFVNYKLKVAEGKAWGLDTTKQYKNETDYFFEELSRPYYEDTVAQKEAIALMRSRLKEEVDASHILIKIADNASPADTLAAYNKALSARDEIASGADFVAVARRVSDDPSAKQNGGRLGYFTAMQMVEEFEDAAFTTKVGEMSGVFRTQFGYHFLLVHDRRRFPGEVKVAHIMKIFPRNATAADVNSLKTSIDSVYELVKQGDDFAELAKRYSDDKQTGMRGGEMPWLSESRLNEGFREFGRQAFALEHSGDVSQVFKTAFGWHIIRLIDKRTERPDSELDNMIDNAMRRGHRVGAAGYDARASKLLKEYSFTWNDKVMQTVTGIMMQQVSDSTKKAQLANIKEPLATYSKKHRLMASDKEVEAHWTSGQAPCKIFAGLARDIIMQHERTMLMEKYPDFRYTMREYYDGLLVYEMNKKVVWNKNDIDAEALKALYENNKPRYSKGGSFCGTIYFCDDESTATKVEQMSDETKAEKMAVRVVKGEQKQGGIYDDYIWPLVKSKYIVVKGVRTDGEVVPMEQIKGQLTSDYQQLEEQKWVKQLRDKYKPKQVGKL